ncbi:MAG: hypothetical protein GY913_26830 [Proteobacteria bacterium]|nr:hypothetical protein [Pseudomonadota bacterium]MCP4920530.1 hypothetical protein [Pseudomonadota bacterium]
MLFSLLVACAQNPEGVWLFHISETPDDAACGTVVSHNFVGAGLPAQALDEDEWELADSVTWSEAELFGLVSATDTGWVLLLDGGIYEASAEDESLVFVEEREELSDANAQHPSGYVFEASMAKTAVRSVSLDEGATWDVDSSDERSWAESDSWSEDIGIGANGEAPVGDYLVVDDGAGGEMAANNGFDVVDCADEPCQLSVSTVCSQSWVVRATKTDLSAEDFESVEPYETDAGL